MKTRQQHGPRKPRRQLKSRVVSVRLDETTAEALESFADARDMTVSACLGMLARRELVNQGLLDDEATLFTGNSSSDVSAESLEVAS